MEQLNKVSPQTLENFDDILAVRDLAVKPVYVAAWNATCYVREMSGLQVGYFASLAKLIDGVDAVTLPVDKIAAIVVMCTCDKNGKLLGKQPGQEGFEDAALEMADKSSDAILTLFNAVVEVSQIGSAQIEEAQKK